MNLSLIRRSIATALILSAATAAQADNLTGNFQASALISGQCRTLTTNALEFGTYDPTAGSDTAASAALSVKCTAGTVVTVAFDAGTTTGASTQQRLLSSGTDTLNYNIFADANHGTVLDTTNKLSGAGLGLATAVDFTVYGAIPKNQLDAAPGSYTDTITVTVSY